MSCLNPVGAGVLMKGVRIRIEINGATRAFFLENELFESRRARERSAGADILIKCLLEVVSKLREQLFL